MTSVGPYYGTGSDYPVWMSPEARDKLRERRNKAVDRIKSLGLAQLVLSVIAIVIGIATLIVASREPMAFPVFNPGPVFAGTLMIILAGIEMLAWRTGEGCRNDLDTPSGLRCMWMAVYILGLIWMMPCIMCGALCILSLFRCTLQITSTSAIYCFPDKDINVTLAALGIVICFVLAVTCILNCVFFCVYAKAFGFKSRGEQAMDYHANMMISTMQQQQQLQTKNVGSQTGNFSSPHYY